MLYVQQSLGADEEIIQIGQFHWMYTVGAVMNIFYGMVVCIIVIVASLEFQKSVGMPQEMGLLDQIRALHPAVRLGAFMCFILGLLRFAQLMVVKATTEIAVTTSRLVYKRGLVARYVGEISIDRIEGVNVLQTILGRILGYGRLMVRGMGVGEVILPPLANPIAFRKSIEKARTL